MEDAGEVGADRRRAANNGESGENRNESIFECCRTLLAAGETRGQRGKARSQRAHYKNPFERLCCSDKLSNDKIRFFRKLK